VLGTLTTAVTVSLSCVAKDTRVVAHRKARTSRMFEAREH